MPLLSFKMPAFLINFFYILNDFNLQILDVSAAVQKSLAFLKYQPVSHKYSKMGFESSNIIVNASDVILFYFFGIILYYLLKLLLKGLLRFPRVKKIVQGWVDSFKFAIIIRMVLESYLIVMISCILNVYALVIHGIIDPVANIIVLFLLFLYIPFPFFTLRFIYKNKHNLADESLQNEFGALYEGLDLKS